MSIFRRSGAARLFLLCLFLLLPPSLCAPASADERGEVFQILDRRTALRWGEDNIAWVVHYPEALVEPWVASEAKRRGLNAQQTDAFRESFKKDLRLESTTAVMLAVHAFGPNPLQLAPLRDNVVLIDSSGNRVAPVAFEQVLDNPLSGLVQGLVFFPKQQDDAFRIVVRGLRPAEETVFAFVAPDSSPTVATDIRTQPETAPSPQAAEEVVVRIPTTKRPSPPQPPSPPKEEEPEYSVETAETYQPTEPVVPPPSTPTAPLPAGEGTALPTFETPDESMRTDGGRAALPPMGARQVLDLYLKSWADGDAERMYSLLSTESQGKISYDLFSREVLSSGFRKALQSGYKVTWIDDTAKVSAAKKVLFMRTLESRQIRFVEEAGTVRVLW
jgi:Predicted membrane protein